VVIFTLLCTHCVFDWLLQGRAAARLKLTHVWVRLMHCLCYTFGVGFVMSFVAVKNQQYVGCILPYILVTHFIFDTPAIKKWWVENVLMLTRDEPDWFWVGLDQSFHLVSLWPVVYFFC